MHGASPLLQPGGSLSIASSTCLENAMMGAGSWAGLLQRERGDPWESQAKKAPLGEGKKPALWSCLSGSRGFFR